jgi:hypothetical protein
VEAAFLSPVVAGEFVFSANPASGRVAVISAETYEVQLFNAGFGPRYVGAIPGGGAIVINELSRDTTLFRVSGGEVSVADERLPVHESANAWAISSDARFAIAWTRSEPEQDELDPTAGSQTVTVLDLEQAQSTRLTVGFHPTQVLIESSSQRAYVVADDGISVIELTDGPAVTALIDVSSDPLEEAAARDVSITPDGRFAVVRLDDSQQLRIVDLRADAIEFYDLGAQITDVDLSRDGALAIATLPGVREVVLIPVPPSAGVASFERVSVPGEVTSSVALSQDNEIALLYQNGEDNSRITVLDLRADEGRALRTLDVKGPVSAAFAAPGAASAIVFQRPMQGSVKEGLFSSLVTLEQRFPKIVGTDAAPTSLAFSEDGSFALVTIGDQTSDVHGVYRVRLDTLQEDFIRLASPPAGGATGIIEGTATGFVAQQHPEGRITFIELDSARAHTVTGFELAARIVD